MNENETPKPQNIVLEILVAIGEFIVRTGGALLRGIWEFLVEYWLLIVPIGIAIIVFWALLGDIITRSFADHAGDPCWEPGAVVQCQLKHLDECMKTERLTQDQCVILIGGGK